MNTEKELFTILKEFNSFCISIELNTRLVDDLGLDSLTMIEFITLLENEFNFNVSDEELINKNFYTVKDVLSFIKRKKKVST